jgi:pimeloyl-ACP methyl ester carboxylesterase
MTVLQAVCLLVLPFAMLHSSATSAAPSGYIDFDPARKDVIVFIHGVTGDARETWTSKETAAYWPQLIREDPRFAAANVWVFSYVSPSIENAQNIEELAIKLADELRPDVFAKHERVYVIAHSMGGLIVREALTRLLPPPEKVPLIYFFGTPSAGADLAGVVAAISANPQFANMRPFTRDSEVASFSRHWLSTAEMPAARYPQKIWSYCAYEIRGVAAGRVVVTPLSASLLCNTSPRAVVANHITMVKPDTRGSEPYLYFLSAYEFVRGEAAQILSNTAAILATTDGRPVRVEALRVRTERLDRQYFDVGCDQTRSGEIPVAAQLASDERVVGAQAIVESTSNLQRSTFQAFVGGNGLPKLKYEIAGLPRVLFNCPCGGNAHVIVKYVVEGG